MPSLAVTPRNCFSTWHDPCNTRSGTHTVTFLLQTRHDPCSKVRQNYTLIKVIASHLTRPLQHKVRHIICCILYLNVIVSQLTRPLPHKVRNILYLNVIASVQYWTRPLQQYIMPSTAFYQLRHYYSKVHEANTATLYNVSQAKHQVKSV